MTWDAAEYDRKFGFVAAEGAAILARLAARAGEVILDLGCGTGELTARIAAAGAEVVGLDADAAMIERARARFPGGAFQQARAEDPGWVAPARFDAVFSNAALHWMEPAPALAHVRATLRTGGRFVAELGGAGNVAGVLAALASARAAHGLPERAAPWFFPGIATMAGLLECAGFEPRWLELIDRPTPVPGLDEGVADWLRMFGARLLEDVPEPERGALLARAVAAARPRLCGPAGWQIDYRRLRFEAVALG